MEGSFLPEIPSAPPGYLGWANGLARSNLNTSALTAENGEDILRRTANAEPFTVSRSGYHPGSSNERDKPFYHVSSDTHDSHSSSWINNFKCIQRYCQPPTADMHQFLKLHCPKKHKSGEVIVSPQLATCSKQFSACKSDKAHSFHLMKEGMGQNFVNQDHSYNSNNKSQAKRLKKAVADCDTENSIKQMSQLF